MSKSGIIKVDIGTDFVSLLFVALIIIGLWQRWFEISFNINIPIAITMLSLGSVGSLKSIVSSLVKGFNWG